MCPQEIYHHKPQQSHVDVKYPKSRMMLLDLKKELLDKGSSFWAGFVSYPRATKFENQDSKEEMILLLRRHFITNLNWISITVLMLVIPWFFSLLGVMDFIPVRFHLASWLLWYMLVLAYILQNFLSWLYNVFIITDERIIDIDFYSMIYKNISECKIDKIEDVTYEQGGFVQAMFDYGNVSIQTAAEQRELQFELVPQPARVAKVLNQLILQEEQEKIEGRVN